MARFYVRGLSARPMRPARRPIALWAIRPFVASLCAFGTYARQIFTMIEREYNNDYNVFSHRHRAKN